MDVLDENILDQEGLCDVKERHTGCREWRKKQEEQLH
jgi:hypothetical protein